MQTPETNEQYSQLQALMIKISSTYINIELDRVEEVVHQSLQEMAEFVNADRAYIFDYDFEKNVCNNTYEWCREGISAEIDNLQNVPLDFIPNWIAIHQKGEAFYMPDINLLPNSGPLSVRGILEPQGVKSLITLPMKVKDELVGFVGFDSVYNFHAYSEKERDLLVVFSQMLVNIAERKRQSEALIRAKNLAEEASKTKEIFLATMSHEIRTPLNVITGMVREMLKGELLPSQRALMSNAKSAAIHLLSILNNILDLSKIESGEFVLDKVVFDINSLMADAHSIMILKAKENNIDLNMEIDPSTPTVWHGDEGRLRQVLVNLMDNAIKFTKDGLVSVAIWSEPDSDNRQRLHMKVTDTGIGISPEFLTNIFSEFAQEHNETSRYYQGVGLGMSIVKNLVYQMEGDIQVKSIKGEGSEFHFYVYMETASPELLPVKHHLHKVMGDYSGNRILLVEDNELNRYVARLSLNTLNCTVVEVDNGKKALEMLEKEAFDLIIMDIQMPVMDGVEATNLIRNQLQLDTPILALTANAYRQNIVKYLESGINECIVKPYLEKNFLDRVIHYLDIKPVAETLESGKPLYDIEQLREVCKYDDRFMENMIRIFIRVVNEAEPRYEELRRQGDFEGVGKLAHKLKPSIDHLGVQRITDTVRLIEKADQQLMSWDEMVTLADELFRVLKKVSAQLSEHLENSI